MGRCLHSFRGYVVQKAYTLYKIGGVVSELLYSPAAYGLDMSVLNAPKPKARICTMVSKRLPACAATRRSHACLHACRLRQWPRPGLACRAQGPKLF